MEHRDRLHFLDGCAEGQKIAVYFALVLAINKILIMQGVESGLVGGQVGGVLNMVVLAIRTDNEGGRGFKFKLTPANDQQMRLYTLPAWAALLVVESIQNDL